MNVMAHQDLEKCIKACNACADACDHCSVACLEEKNVADMDDCIRLDIDCAALCRLASAFMARESMCATTLCRACAEVCNACADECEKHDHDHCKRCAKACRECATACQSMAA